MQELEKIQVSENSAALDEARDEASSDEICPDHPLGQDLFYVLWNANRT